MPQEGEIKTWLETKYEEPIIFHGICTIGRAESNNIIVSKGAVSRHHAIIHEREGAYWIVDLGGQNGTLLNGERIVQAARLKSGDLIRIPLMDFVFRQEATSAQAPAPAESKTVSPEPSSTETSIPTAVTVPLPVPVKPRQQDELPLGLPPEPLDQTDKSKKPRVYVGPIDTQGLPKALPARPARPGVKLPETVTAEASRAIHLPKPSDDLLKITTPLSLSPLIEKSKEVIHINAPDVIVPEPEKPTVPAVAETDSFLQPSSAQEAASSTKSVALLQKPREPAPASSAKAPPPRPVAAPQIVAMDGSAESETDSFILAPPIAKEPVPSPALHHPPAPAKPDKPEGSSSDRPVPISLVSAKPGESKAVIKKAGAPAKKEGLAPEIVPVADLSAVGTSAQPIVCASATRSMYIGLASIFLPFVGLLVAPIAIILGHSALNKINQSRGMLTGRQSAVLGLYFGYISLSLISGYSILIYFLFFSPNQSRGPDLSASPPPLLVLSPQSTTPLPAATPGVSNPGPASPAVANPPAIDTPLPRVTPDLQVSTPSAPAPQVTSPAQDATPSSQPQATPPPALPAASPTAPTPQVVTSDGAGANPSVLLPQNNPPPAETNATPSVASATPESSIPPAVAPPPAVYDPVALNRLKDGMLLQPMPEDTSSRAYMDAESFNNCARILARPPEARYAESVGDFLEDVKKRNPDPARLQILTFMYDKYMAGIKRDE